MTILLSILATYGVTKMIVDSDGPWGIFYKLRRVSWLGALECYLCLSVYIGAVVALYSAHNVLQWVLYTFAFSGGAILLNKLGERDG